MGVVIDAHGTPLGFESQVHTKIREVVDLGHAARQTAAALD
jgi:hypothetical protein